MTHIAEARARAEGGLGSTCTITGPSAGPAVIDDDTGIATRPAGPTIHADQPCSVAPVGAESNNDDLAGQQIPGQRYRVALRADATGIKRGHTLTITAVDEDGGPDLIGVALTIDEVIVRSKTVLRRVICVDTRGTSARVPG